MLLANAALSALLNLLLFAGLPFFAYFILVLMVMPEMWGVLPIILAAALFCGWVWIKSGSIFGPWLLHASGNVAMCLSVAARTAT
jgi:hypothetical protein